MQKGTVSMLNQLIITAVLMIPFIGCSKAYYGAMEKVGIHKRDILVDLGGRCQGRSI
ncbi:MAG: DUF2959 domain-containing protein [Desulfobacterales bacterium]|nr:DUF2959 domain-containing protein [Desulfobacterales bacterium]